MQRHIVIVHDSKLVQEHDSGVEERCFVEGEGKLSSELHEEFVKRLAEDQRLENSIGEAEVTQVDETSEFEEFWMGLSGLLGFASVASVATE